MRYFIDGKEVSEVEFGERVHSARHYYIELDEPTWAWHEVVQWIKFALCAALVATATYWLFVDWKVLFPYAS